MLGQASTASEFRTNKNDVQNFTVQSAQEAKPRSGILNPADLLCFVCCRRQKLGLYGYVTDHKYNSIPKYPLPLHLRGDFLQTRVIFTKNAQNLATEPSRKNAPLPSLF